jgi:alanyl-tRNA synthetase
MTERLYYDSDALHFTAQVIAHDGDPARVILDRTAFYPTSGGQPHDTGTLGGIPVLDVIDHGEAIVHVLAEPLGLGPVRGEVDGLRRHDFTVQHTAQHLISALAGDHMGWRTESVHFGAVHSTIELGATSVSDEQVTELERAANLAARAASAVTVSYEEAGTAVGLRKPPDRDGVIRVVTIAAIDRSACGGTHVASTAALSPIRITGTERVRGRIRLGFLAGDRALQAAREADQRLAQLAAATGAAPAELVGTVVTRLQALQEAEQRLGVLERQLAAYHIAELRELTPSDTRGVRRLVVHPGDRPIGTLRHWAAVAAALPGTILIATVADPPTVVIAAAPDTGLDAAGALVPALEAVGGRGGGSPRIAQGTVPDAASLHRVVTALAAAEP